MESILIIEDSRTFAGMLRQHIETALPYPCVIVESLAQAKTTLKQRSDQFFAAIVDLNLPDAPDGEAVDLVIEHQLAAIVFTGTLNEQLRDIVQKKGIADYVLKQGQYSFEYIISILHRLYNNRFYKALVVDDNRANRELISKLLSIHRYPVVSAADCQQAMELLLADKDIRFAIVDYFLPDDNGANLVARMREMHQRHSLATIGISAGQQAHIAAEFLKKGANDFLRLPFYHEEFYSRINAITCNMELIEDLHATNEQRKSLLGMAAHDIRSPLSVVNNAAKRLNSQELTGRAKTLADMIERNSSDLLGLLSTLLDYSAIETGSFNYKPEPCNLGKLVAELIQNHLPAASDKQLTLCTQIDDVVDFRCDPTLTRQVMDNLISNAIKFTPPGASITVSLQQQENQVRYQVQDEGPGINQDEQKKLFKAFQKLSNKPTAGESSNGLGLAICKKIVECHHGVIGYQPNQPTGSCFYFELPIADC